MGTEFIQKVGDTLRRSRDEGRIRLATPDLTTRELLGNGRAIAADIVNGAKLTPGQSVTLELDGKSIIARQALAIVARDDSPTIGTLEALERHHKILPGVVSTVHDIAHVVEITLSC